MAYARFNFSGLEQEPDYFQQAIQRFGQGAMAPLRAQAGMEQYQQEIEKQRLANDLIRAQIEREKMYGGLSNLSGTAKEAASLDVLGKIYGKDSDIYRRALDSFELGQRHTNEIIASSQFYRNNPWRLYDPTTKSFQAQSMAARGLFPEGGQAYPTPEQAQSAVDTYESERYGKKPSFLQQSALAGAQLDDTIDFIKGKNLKEAFSYSGPKGQAELLRDRAQSALTGNLPDKLKNYEEIETAMHAFREQFRTYLGASVTLGMTKDLDYLVKPINWVNHPAVAEAKFNALVDIYEKEKERTQKALTKGNPYGQQQIFTPNNQERQTPELKSAAEQIGLKPKEYMFTKENIEKTAKEKKWPKYVTDYVLKKAGY